MEKWCFEPGIQFQYGQKWTGRSRAGSGSVSHVFCRVCTFVHGLAIEIFLPSVYLIPPDAGLESIPLYLAWIRFNPACLTVAMRVVFVFSCVAGCDFSLK